jgi:hypothetical protein
MTTFTTRNEILQSKRVINSELTKLQKAYFDEDLLQPCSDDNEEHPYLKLFDCLGNEEIEYVTFNKTIGLNHSDIDTYAMKLSEKLKEMFQSVNVTNLIVISHIKCDFFGNRKNAFEPLKNAYEKLEQIVGGKTYMEAFEIDIDSLPDFVEILFWTARCDPSVAEFIFLFDQHERVSFNICKYGNIHLTEYYNERLTQGKLRELGWTNVEGEEFDQFTPDGKIIGRQYDT